MLHINNFVANQFWRGIEAGVAKRIIEMSQRAHKLLELFRLRIIHPAKNI